MSEIAFITVGLLGSAAVGFLFGYVAGVYVRRDSAPPLMEVDEPQSNVTLLHDDGRLRPYDWRRDG